VLLGDVGDYYAALCTAILAIATGDLALFMDDGQATVYLNLPALTR
jgi:hypothetical protein